MSHLTKSLDKAAELSTRSVNLARNTVEKMASIDDMLADASPSGDGVRRESYTTAAKQYQANRGWVFAAVDLLASRVAGQQIFIASDRATADATPRTEKAVGDSLEPLTAHPLLSLLEHPNDLMSGQQLVYSTVASVALTGRSLWWVDASGDDTVIFPIPTNWITSVDQRRRTWKIRMPSGANFQEHEVPGDETVLFNRQDPSDPWGCISTLAAISEAVCTDEKISDSQYRVFSQGHWPAYALKVGTAGGTNQRPTLTAEQRQQLILSLRRSYRGSTQSGDPLILDGLIESATKLSLTPEELAFLDSGKMTKARILQAFRISPILLGEVEGANRASATVADQVFCSATANPMISLIEQAMTRYLAPMFAGDSEKLTIWIEKCRARDDEMSLKRWNAGAARGYVTPNEYRKHILTLEPIDGGDELPPPPMQPASKSMINRLNPYTLRRLQDSE